MGKNRKTYDVLRAVICRASDEGNATSNDGSIIDAIPNVVYW